MAKHNPPLIYPSRLAPGRFGLSGRLPNPVSWRRLASGYNFASARLRKQVFQYAYGNTGTNQEAPPTAGDWSNYFVFRTGLNTEAIEAVIGFSPAQQSATSFAKGCVIELVDSALNSYSKSYKFSGFEPGTFGPSDLHWAVVRVENVPSDTVLRGSLYFENFAQVSSVTIYEVAPRSLDDAVTGVCDPTPFSVHGDISGDDVSNVVETGDALWRRNGAQLFSWSMHDQVSFAVKDDNTITNLLDGRIYNDSVALQKGYYIDTTYQGTRTRDVGVEIGVYAERISGTGKLGIRLYDDSTGIALGTVGDAADEFGASADPLATWQTTIPAMSGKVRPILSGTDSSGSTVWRVYALGLWLYEPI